MVKNINFTARYKKQKQKNIGLTNQFQGAELNRLLSILFAISGKFLF